MPIWAWPPAFAGVTLAAAVGESSSRTDGDSSDGDAECKCLSPRHSREGGNPGFFHVVSGIAFNQRFPCFSI